MPRTNVQKLTRPSSSSPKRPVDVKELSHVILSYFGLVQNFI